MENSFEILPRDDFMFLWTNGDEWCIGGWQRLTSDYLTALAKLNELPSASRLNGIEFQLEDDDEWLFIKYLWRVHSEHICRELPDNHGLQKRYIVIRYHQHKWIIRDAFAGKGFAASAMPNPKMEI